jgi:hypothetical protein
MHEGDTEAENYQNKKHFHPPAVIYKNTNTPAQPQVFDLKNALFH